MAPDFTELLEVAARRLPIVSSSSVRIGSVAVLAVTVSAVIAVAQETPPASVPALTDSRVQNSVLLDSMPLTVNLAAEATPFTYLQKGHHIRFQRHLEVPVLASHSGTYTLEMLCDQEQLEMVLLDTLGTIVANGRRVPQRRFKRRILVDLRGERKCSLIVGSGSTRDLRIRLGLFPGSATHLGPDPMRPSAFVVREGSAKGALSPQDGVLEGVTADFLELDSRAFDGKWLRVRLASSAFDPVLYGLSRDDDVVKVADDKAPGVRDAELVLDPKAGVTTLVVTAYRSDEAADSLTVKGEYDISLKAFPFKPTPFLLGWLEYIILNPLVSFILGSVVTLLVGYYFFWRTLRTRRICFEEEADYLLIDNRRGDQPTLLAADDRPLRCASLYRIRLWHGGHARIAKDLVRSPLVLTLEHVSSIPTLRHEVGPGASWSQPVVRNTVPLSIELPFDRLDRGDHITLSLVCEQAAPRGIVPRLSGDIAETSIQSVEAVISNTVVWLVVTANFGFLLLSPIILLDVFVFDFGLLPRGFQHMLGWIWGPLSMLQLGFFALTSRGRRLFRGIAKGVMQAEPARDVFRRWKLRTVSPKQDRELPERGSTSD